MSTPREIPLGPAPRRLTITLAGVVWQLRTRWCDPQAAWVIDFLDVNGADLLDGVPLVTGVDLLEQFAHLDFGGQLIAQTDHEKDAPPTLANLGSTGHLYFVTP